MNTRYQRALLWSSIVLLAIYVLAWAFLIGTLPIPPATATAAQIAAFFTENQEKIRWGGVITSWVAGYGLPFSFVLGMQMARVEKGVPFWSILQLMAGTLQAMFMILPMILWATAAYTPERMPDVTAVLHQIATLMMITTDQVYIFQFIPFVVICLTRKSEGYTAFPRWLGFLTIWAIVIFELSTFAYVPKTGPFAWNGLFTFWLPYSVWGIWLVVVCPRLFKAIRMQKSAPEEGLQEQAQYA
jgi:hypothetical protein